MSEVNKAVTKEQAKSLYDNLRGQLEATKENSIFIKPSEITNPATVSSNAASVINAAITKANANGMHFVVVPAGEYWLTETVYLKSDVILKGCGMDATTLKIADNCDIDAIRVSAPTNNSGIMDMFIDGNRIQNYSTYANGHHGNAINVWLHYGRIERVRTNWVYKHSLLLNYDTGDSDDGLGFEPEHQNDMGNLNKVLWCDFRDSLLQGVMWGWRTMDSWMCYTNIGSHAANLYLEGGTSRFIGNHFDGDGDNGAGPEYNVYCGDGCRAMVFEDNIFENTQKENIFFRQPSYSNQTMTITIANNIIRTCSKSQNEQYANIKISGYSSSVPATEIIISGNQILNPDTNANHGYAGIHLLYCENSKITGNTFFNVGDDEVLLDNTCENVLDDSKISEDVSSLKTEITKAQEDVHICKESLGLEGENVDYGTSNPIVITGDVGIEVNLEFATAESFLEVGKNLFPQANVTGTRFKNVKLPVKYPAGKYVFSAVVTSEDTVRTQNQVQFMNGSASALADITCRITTRGTRAYFVADIPTEFDNMNLYASTGYAESAGFAFEFADIQLERASAVTDYEAYSGVLKEITEPEETIQLEKSSITLYSGDASNIHAYSENGTAEPIIPVIQKQIEELDERVEALEEESSDVSQLEDAIGTEGTEEILGTGNPVSLELVGLLVNVEGQDSDQYTIVGKNLYNKGDVTFTQYKSINLGITYPAGTYHFSAIATSSDTDANACLVAIGLDGTWLSSHSIARGVRSGTTFEITSPFNAIGLYASDSYPRAAGDTASFVDIQIEVGNVRSDFEEYKGVIKDIGEISLIQFAPAYIYSTNGSEISVSHIQMSPESIQDRLEKASYRGQFPYGKYFGRKIINFGDSIYGQIRPPKDVSTALARLTGATVYNCGFGGCRMSEHVASYWTAFSMYSLADAISENDFSEQDQAIIDGTGTLPSYFADTVALLKTIDFNTVDAITIGYGTNDFTGSVGLDNENNALDTTKLAGALRYSIEKILSAYPHIKIYICCPTYRFWMDGSYEFIDDSNTHQVNGKTLLDFVAKEKEVAEEYQTQFIDNYYELGFNKFNRGYYFNATDGTHPNVHGTKQIAEHIAHEMW